MEKAAKFMIKIGIIMLALFGIRYLLSFVGVIIPLEWFYIMFCGLLGASGIIFLLIYVFYINFS